MYVVFSAKIVFRSCCTELRKHIGTSHRQVVARPRQQLVKGSVFSWLRLSRRVCRLRGVRCCWLLVWFLGFRSLGTLFLILVRCRFRLQLLFPLARISGKAGSSMPPSRAGSAYRRPGCVRRVSSTRRPAKPEVVESSGGIAGGSHVEGAAADPTRAQLRTLFMHSAVPMVGFGKSWQDIGYRALELPWRRHHWM